MLVASSKARRLVHVAGVIGRQPAIRSVVTCTEVVRRAHRRDTEGSRAHERHEHHRTARDGGDPALTPSGVGEPGTHHDDNDEQGGERRRAAEPGQLAAHQQVHRGADQDRIDHRLDRRAIGDEMDRWWRPPP